jgi:hypothetical protein
MFSAAVFADFGEVWAAPGKEAILQRAPPAGKRSSCDGMGNDRYDAVGLQAHLIGSRHAG